MLQVLVALVGRWHGRYSRASQWLGPAVAHTVEIPRTQPEHIVRSFIQQDRQQRQQEQQDQQRQ